MMANSSYTVPLEENDEININNQNENELQSIDDLPKFLHKMINLSPIKWKKTFVLLAIITQVGFGGILYTYFTQNPIVGLVLGTYQVFGECIMLTLPDFTKKGVFLEVLLRDAKTTKKINANMFNSMISTLISFPLVMTPIMWYFFILPLAETNLLGPSTFMITLVVGGLATLAVIPYSLLCSIQSLPDQVSLVHIDKITKYLETVRRLILRDNAEDGIPLVDKLSLEQEKVEKWIVQINNGMSTFNTLMLSYLSGLLVLNLILLGYSSHVGPMILFFFFSTWMFVMIANMLYAISKPNLVWEQQQILLLNDAKVILNLKFPKENFESWLNKHNLNASRVFRTKVTFEKMKQAAGVLTSAFGIVLYVLLREDIKVLLG